MRSFACVHWCRPLNLVCVSQRNETVIKLIDFDASAKFGEPCHLKFSSAFAPPQLAAELLAYESDTGYKPTDALAPMPWAKWVQTRGKLIASVAKDIWAFGILAFKLCAEDGASMFWSSEADNIVRHTDLETLAYFWNQNSVEQVARVVWDDAADMILKCLQAAENSRPQSFAELMGHPFFYDIHEAQADPQISNMDQSSGSKDLSQANQIMHTNTLGRGQPGPWTGQVPGQLAQGS